jgi:GAF domain-containing protein
VRAGVNWAPGVVGHATIPANEGSAAAHALLTGEPLITENVASEARFEIPMLLSQHAVKSTVNVLIRGENKPFGILEVDSRQLRSFTQDDVDFLQKSRQSLVRSDQACERPSSVGGASAT